MGKAQADMIVDGCDDFGKKIIAPRFEKDEVKKVIKLRFGTTGDLNTQLSHFEESSAQPFNLRSVLLDFQSFTDKPVFECAFAHPTILF